LWTPPCDCPASQAAGLAAMVTLRLQGEGAREFRERDLEIRCSHCGKILKYVGTETWTDPQTGERGYRTVVF